MCGVCEWFEEGVGVVFGEAVRGRIRRGGRWFRRRSELWNDCVVLFWYCVGVCEVKWRDEWVEWWGGNEWFVVVYEYGVDDWSVEFGVRDERYEYGV